MHLHRWLLVTTATVALVGASVGCSSTTPSASTSTSAKPAVAPGSTAGAPGSTTATTPATTGTTAPTAPTTATTAGTASTSAAAAGNEVVIADYVFTPATLTVKAGTLVVWTNNDEFDHWVISQDKTTLDSKPFGQGATYQHPFTEPGTFAYYCNIHNQMKGTIVVT